MHQAVTRLERGESELALAGGVHTMLSGRLLELRANAGMLSPDGRCATFDAAATGYVRGEGCGIVVLKRLDEPEADGDRLWGVIRSTALNQDGASPSLTVPSRPAQERRIKAPLARAGIEPARVDYLKAPGPGTPVGDPIELEATAAAYGRGRDPERPLLVGSVKTNIGHVESAAGVAGVIKTILAMKYRVAPKHLHFRTLNPDMGWDGLPLRGTAEPTPWPVSDDHPPTAGVNGFGIDTGGGTLDELRRNVREAADCCFDDDMDLPRPIRLHYAKVEVLVARSSRGDASVTETRVSRNPPSPPRPPAPHRPGA